MIPRRDAFWLPPVDLLTRPSLTHAALVEFEITRGVKLPMVLVELLAMQNGGFLRYDTFIGPDAEPLRVEFLRGLDAAWSRRTSDDVVEIPLAHADDRTIALRWAGAADAPSVVARAPDGTMRLLADHFDAFLEGLVDGRPTWQIGLVAEDEILDDVADWIEERLDTPFEALDAELRRAPLRGRDAQGGTEAELLLRTHGRTHALHDAPWAPEVTHILEVDAERRTVAWLLQELAERSPVVLHEPHPSLITA